MLQRQGGAVLDEAEALVTKIYSRMPSISITDLMFTVDEAAGFTDPFSDLRKGSPPVDRRALLSVLLADGINIGLRKMADACPEPSCWELVRTATWAMSGQKLMIAHSPYWSMRNRHCHLPPIGAEDRQHPPMASISGWGRLAKP